MEKKNFKWYEAPQVEVVEMEVSASLLAGSPGDTNDPDTSVGGDPEEN